MVIITYYVKHAEIRRIIGKISRIIGKYIVLSESHIIAFTFVLKHFLIVVNECSFI